VIARAEERELFKATMEKCGLETCRGRTCEDASPRHGKCSARDRSAGGDPAEFHTRWVRLRVAFNKGEFDAKVQRGLDLSPVGEVLVEESILGWKEYEMEVMRDADDNAVIICASKTSIPVASTLATRSRSPRR
jgi:carbamoyl-phosphate synthase large subunit